MLYIEPDYILRL